MTEALAKASATDRAPASDVSAASRRDAVTMSRAVDSKLDHLLAVRISGLQHSAQLVEGIAVLVSGGGLLEVSIVFCLGGLLGLLSSLFWMYRFVVRPKIDVDRSRWVALMRAGVPLGLAVTLYYALLKFDATLLSFLKGGDNTEVGQYGAAYRLIEATMFVSWAFGGAVMPWLSRHGAETTVSLARGYELGLKALVAMLLPIGAFFGAYAEPLIELLYGKGYAEAVTPLPTYGRPMISR